MPEFARQLYNRLISPEIRFWLYKLRHRDSVEDKRRRIYPSEKGDFSLKPYDEHRCIFVHITKTAGTAVAKCLFGYLPYHYTATDYRVIYGRRDFDRYYKFAFVRNPWDRLYSAWRFLKAGGCDDEDRRWFEENIAQYPDFESFVLQWLSDDKLSSHKHFWPQHWFVCDARRRLIVDEIAYFETIDDDFERISEHLGIDAQLEPHNTNPGNSYSDAYTEDMIKVVADIYARDIEMFGYSFDSIVARHTPTGSR